MSLTESAKAMDGPPKEGEEEAEPEGFGDSEVLLDSVTKD